MGLGVGRVVRDREPAEAFAARRIALLQRLEHLRGQLLELERNVDLDPLPGGGERGELTIAPVLAGGREPVREHGERGRAPARLEEHARGVHARPRADALHEVRGGEKLVDGGVGVELARREQGDHGIGPLVRAEVAGVQGELRGLRVHGRRPVRRAIAVETRDRGREDGGLLRSEDARGDRGVLAREAGDVTARALVDAEAALDRAEPVARHPAIRAPEQGIHGAEQRARIAVGERALVPPHERERLAGHGAERARDRRGRERGRDQVARERLSGGVARGLRERGRIFLARLAEHDLEPAR